MAIPDHMSRHASSSARARVRRPGLFGLVLLAVCFAALASQVRAANPQIDVVDLGTLGGNSSLAAALNESGQVVGQSTTTAGDSHAFSWTAAGGMIDLGTLSGAPSMIGRVSSDAKAVNNNGLIVGGSLTAGGQFHAVMWTAGGRITDLGTLGGNTSEALGVNDSGQIIGQSQVASGEYHAFSWTAARGMIDLGTLGGTYSTPHAVNVRGQVVGDSYIAGNIFHAFSWTAEGGMIDLGTLGGTYSWTETQAVNAMGQVVGSSTTASGDDHAFLWTARGGMIDLGTLGGTRSHAFGINASGQVVGDSEISPGITHAVLWTAAGGVIDLGTLGGTRPPGPYNVVSRALAVNDSGQVMGLSLIADNVTYHAFLWTATDGMIDLGTLGGSGGAAPSAMNGRGQVVGGSSIAGGASHAVLWQVGTCGEDVTNEVDIYGSPFFPVFFTPFRFQWVIVRNHTSTPIAGPLVFVMDDLENAVFVGSRQRTFCFSQTGSPFLVIHDDVLSPGDSVLAFLLFLETEPERITYTPRVLSGIPTR